MEIVVKTKDQPKKKIEPLVCVRRRRRGLISLVDQQRRDEQFPYGFACGNCVCRANGKAKN